MYVQEEGLCLALGLPMISFYARPHSTIGADVFLQVGTAGGRVERGGMSRAAWEEGLLTLCRWAGAVVCSLLRSNWAGRPAFQVFVWTAIVVPWSSPSQPRAKPSSGLELRSRSRFRLARRSESNRIGVDQTGQKGPFLDPLSV